ncbi:lim and transglutaminase domain protein ltd-1-like [Haliotis rubra]|uniref:lim and transglutaminase domain protein ltd-1-like n=1 Tax=Haliotis rubra TaxID=36100 RepID=UPI001EE63087|nr:lim and transglutaminase domain protein ltd-1-like [Haliotis rubra]
MGCSLGTGRVSDSGDLEPEYEPLHIPWTEDWYPAPCPPTSKKADIFHIDDFKEIDEKAVNCPAVHVQSYDALMEYLTEDCINDLQKLRSVFTWLGSQDVYGGNYGKTTSNESPRGYMKLMREGKGSYAALFALLCRAAGLPCVIVYGVSKGFDYDVGDRDIHHLRNCWNCVYVDGSWRIIHPLWTFKKVQGFDKGRWTKEKQSHVDSEQEKMTEGTEVSATDDFYFLVEPEVFIYMCRPSADMTAWQLLKTPWSWDAFVTAPYFRQRYFLYELTLTSLHRCILPAREGTVEIVFTAPEHSPMNFACELFFDQKASFERIPKEIKLDRHVLVMTKQDKKIFFVRIPVAGIYRLRIYGGINRLFHMCDFRLDCDRPLKNCRPLPLFTPIGFGFTQKARDSGLDFPSEYSGVVRVESGNGRIFNFTMIRQMEIMTTVLHTKFASEFLKEYVTCKMKDLTVSVYVYIPETQTEEEYVLQIFTREAGTTAKYRNAVNYLIIIDRKQNSTRDPMEWRNRLNVREINGREHIADFEHIISTCDTPETETMENGSLVSIGASGRREILMLERDLKAALFRRNIDALDRALAAAHQSRHTTHLDYLIKQADEVREQLGRLRKYLHHVLEIKQPTLSELHNYKRPIDPIHATMRGTYILLGEHAIELESWEFVQNLMRKVGKNSLIYRLMEFDVIQASKQQIEAVQALLDQFNEQTVTQASIVAGHFYVWCRDIVIESEISTTRNAFKRKEEN